MCSSTSPELRKEHLSELLHYYHDQLIEHLGELGYPSSVLPFDDFQKEFDAIFPFGFVFGIFSAQVKEPSKNYFLQMWEFQYLNFKNCFKVILSEDAAKSGGLMDMNDVKSEEEMNEKLKDMDNQIVTAAAGNVTLQKRIVGLVEEAIERNIIWKKFCWLFLLCISQVNSQNKLFNF